MRKITFTMFAMTGLIAMSCNKNVCTECHYERDGEEVEIGEYCDEDIEKLEEEGYTVDSTTYEAHCGEH